MRIEALLPRQTGDCISCPDPLPCNCSSTEECVRINRGCYSCSQTQCVAKSGSSGSGSGGVSKGALAGAVVGALVFLIVAITFFLWYRRKSRLRKRLAAAREPPKDIPASAETVLNRPDPIEKYVTPSTEASTVRVYTNSDTTIDLDPNSQRSTPHHQHSSSRQSNINPFDDATSIQTAGTEGTNVIPIALVPTDSQRPFSSSSAGHTQLSASSSPVRPARSPDLYLDHVNVSSDSIPPAKYALSTRSGVSGFTNRNSFGSYASFSSDFLNEAPMIITPNKGAVRQVLGVVKAEVINASAPGSTSGSSSLKPPPTTRPAAKSPLASTPLGPADLVKNNAEPIDPFSDNASINAEYSVSPAPTATTFAPASTAAARESQQSQWVPEAPNVPWAHSGGSSRPSSMSTQAGSIINIESATRVQVGLSSFAEPSPPLSPNGNTRTAYRTTMGRLISPSSANSGSMQDQQQRAITQAQAQGSDISRRVSSGSAMSATSTRADSILEFFPFVPPSPISNRPVRSPPVSPLTQQSFSTTVPPSPASSSVQHVISIAPPSPLSQDAFSESNSQAGPAEDVDSLPPPPNRKTLGLSTGSQLSTASSGLGSFPFQIETGESSTPPPSSFNRQRASLDTLALTSDLSSYPLGFDRESVQAPMPPIRKS
ncbi:hypothetical protein H0H93_002055 [Arthromyces matolae]|nr:hypothetical protein H0H93_002055 [Arthromyces matolae]